MFEKILNWKLLAGSHEFPGPDGGTCIMEAAIVAAGFEYRPVGSEVECPPCFSPVIARYAIGLNDMMPDALRQELLMPFVTRLAGTADTPAKEVERAEFIAVQTVKRVLPMVFRAIGLKDCADACAAVKDSAGAAAAARAVQQSTSRKAGWGARYGVGAAANVAALGAACAAADAAAVATLSPHVAAADASLAATHCATAVGGTVVQEEICRVATAILDEAIGLGKRATPLETEAVVSRMEAVRQRAVAMQLS